MGCGIRLTIEVGCGIREILKAGCGTEIGRRDQDMLHLEGGIRDWTGIGGIRDWTGIGGIII